MTMASPPVLAKGFPVIENTYYFRIAFLIGRTGVAMGIVKWFNATKGYGFIQPDGGGKDVFVHISAVEKAGYTSLAEGARISYEEVAGRSGKVSAENLRLG
jgi:CspA family cold shock protein